MPTAETLRSLVGLLDSQPRERQFEFLFEPTGEDESNFYMEPDTLPLDFNDIFEVNTPPSSFHGKIQATLGSIFEECLLQNVGRDNKDHIASDIIEDPTNATTPNPGEPVSMLHSEEVTKAEGVVGDFVDDSNSEESNNNIDLSKILLENGILVTSDTDSGENTDNDNIAIWNIFNEFENTLENEGNVIAVKSSSCNAITKTEDMEMKVEDRDDIEEEVLVKEDGLDHNAWKCRLYRARRKRKMEDACSELNSLEKDHKRLKMTHEKMLSNIKKIRKYYIQSIQRGNFYLKL